MNALLQEALALYGLAGAQAMFLQHNENLTYRVGDRFLLRIHSPAAGIHAPSTVEDRRIELAFLQHLRAHGMPVQEPIPNAKGEFVSILADGTAATLMTWVPGRDLSGMEHTGELCFRIGEMTARLHRASRGFTMPGIRAYDAAQCQRMEGKLAAMVQRHRLENEYAATLQNACRAVAESFTSSSDDLLAIHDDLSPSNILETDSGLIPIDFSLCGMGRPMTDVGMLVAGFNSTLRRSAILRGYEAAGGVLRRRELEAGFIHGLLCAFVFHADTWPLEPWFADRLRRWKQEMLQPFSEGKPIFDEAMNFIYIQ